MTNFIIIAVITLILGVSIRYIIKEKKAGARCIGCSMAGQCAARANGYACSSQAETKA